MLRADRWKRVRQGRVTLFKGSMFCAGLKIIIIQIMEYAEVWLC